MISIIGDYLEHSRLYYFHNLGDSIIYSGSADVMIRSFERRIEALFKINDDFIKKQVITILNYNLRDNCNTYELSEDGDYIKKEINKPADKFNIFEEFFKLSKNQVEDSIMI